MIKYLSLATAFALLAGCSSGTPKDTGDTAGDTDETGDTDTDVPVAFEMTGHDGLGFAGDCADGLCIYRVTTTTEAGVVELDMTETGDSFMYTENHNGFALESENADGSFTYRLDLDWVTSLDDVVVNATTLFNPNVSDGDIFDRTTWYFGAQSADGTETDCRVTGHDPTYYSEWCTNVVR